MPKKPFLAGFLLFLLIASALGQNLAGDAGYALQTGLGALGGAQLVPAWDFLTDFTQTVWMVINEYSSILAGSEVKFNEYLIYNLFGVTKEEFEDKCGVIKVKAEPGEELPETKPETYLGVFAIIGAAFLFMMVAGGHTGGKAIGIIIIGVVALGFFGTLFSVGLGPEIMTIIINILTIIFYVYFLFDLIEEGISSESPWKLIILASLTILFVFAFISLMPSLTSLFQQLGTMIGIELKGDVANTIGAIVIVVGVVLAIIGAIGFGLQLVTIKRKRDETLDFLNKTPLGQRKEYLRTGIDLTLSRLKDEHKVLGRKYFGLPFLLIGISLIFIGLAPLNTGETPLMKITPPNIVAVYYFAALITLFGALTMIPHTDVIYNMQKTEWARAVGITETLGIRQEIFDLTTENMPDDELQKRVEEAQYEAGKFMRTIWGKGMKGIMSKIGGPAFDKDQIKSLSKEKDPKNKDLLKGLGKSLGFKNPEELADETGDNVWVMVHAPFYEIMNAVDLVGWAGLVLVIVLISAFAILALETYASAWPLVTNSLPCFTLHVNLLTILLWSFFVVAAVVFVFNRASFSMMVLLPTPIYTTLQTLFGKRILGTIFKFALTLYLVIVTVPAIKDIWALPEGIWSGLLFYSQPALAIIILALVKFISSFNYILEVNSLKFMEGFLHKFFDKLAELPSTFISMKNKFHKVLGLISLGSGIFLLILAWMNPEAGQVTAGVVGWFGAITSFAIASIQAGRKIGGKRNPIFFLAYLPSVLPWVYCALTAANPYAGLFPLTTGIIYLFVPDPGQED